MQPNEDAYYRTFRRYGTVDEQIRKARKPVRSQLNKSVTQDVINFSSKCDNSSIKKAICALLKLVASE